MTDFSIWPTKMATVQDYLNNAKWVKRIDESFDTFDANKNGYITREEWLITVDKFAKIVTDRPAEIAKLRAATSEHANAMGLTEGVQVDKKKFRELAAAMSLAEIGRRDRGEMTMVEKADNARFDVLDKNRDGYVTWDEYKVVLKVVGLDEEVGRATFDLLDRNKSGKIDRKEYTDSNIKFWCTLDDPDTQRMYGDRFE